MCFCTRSSLCRVDNMHQSSWKCFAVSFSQRIFAWSLCMCALFACAHRSKSQHHQCLVHLLVRGLILRFVFHCVPCFQHKASKSQPEEKLLREQLQMFKHCVRFFCLVSSIFCLVLCKLLLAYGTRLLECAAKEELLREPSPILKHCMLLLSHDLTLLPCS